MLEWSQMRGHPYVTGVEACFLRQRLLPIILGASLLAACGGGGGPAGSLPATHPQSAKTGTVNIKLAVPSARAAKTPKLRRRYTVASNTLGVQVQVYPSGNRTTVLATTLADISGASPNCTGTSNGGRNCTIALNAPAGADDFVFTTYDQTPGPSAPAGNAIGYGVASATVTTGSPTTVNVTLDSILASLSVVCTPNAFHTLIPATFTANVYALDADSDVIISSGFSDAQGNPLTVTVSLSSSLNSSLSIASPTFSQPITGVQISYNGQAPSGGSIGVSASTGSITSNTATITAVYPSFTSIADPNLNVNNIYHGGIGFDSTQADVFYTTSGGFGAISYYNGTTVTSLAGTGAAPIRGGLMSSSATVYVITGTTANTVGAGPVLTAVANTNLAPIPNGGGMVLNGLAQSLEYMSGTNLVFYQPFISTAASSQPIGVNTVGGMALDSNGNAWIVDTAFDDIHEFNGSNQTFPLAPGMQTFDVTTTTLGPSVSVWLTDHGTTPEIVQLNGSGGIVGTYPLPNGGTPWYMMNDTAQAGVIWFDYLLNGQIGLGRMDTNVSPPAFTFATDTAGPVGTQAGAIGSSPNGDMYMVFDGQSTLVQVQQ